MNLKKQQERGIWDGVEERKGKNDLTKFSLTKIDKNKQ